MHILYMHHTFSGKQNGTGCAVTVGDDCEEAHEPLLPASHPKGQMRVMPQPLRALKDANSTCLDVTSGSNPVCLRHRRGGQLSAVTHQLWCQIRLDSGKNL
jgi:hypothetical protein